MSIYASLAQLYVHGAPQRAFGSISDADKEAALEAASETIDTYFRGRFPLPLVTWDHSVVENTCKIAAYELISGARGYNPAAGADTSLLDRYNQAISWCVKVQKQQAHPNVTASVADTTPRHTQPMVMSSSVVNLATGQTAKNRGW